ncbi:Penicillin-binding protein 2D [Aquimixticola soesokkakensis]|uniref:Biosynthetic peptidoglycan transglycosylase n=1 Tax=Aquimixticola soesokkakensis TaxID=1519096 RepID=A0A1Y5R6L4_9RHOB|nr:monofunctional biosynthetic peptidoglycan transglycosylase [Aquimixticola soesokkakensis]SLN10380.1 Penicillin-binding protein 2D [Aquimixticola soesokkakensis]
MAKASKSKSRKRKTNAAARPLRQRLRRTAGRLVLGFVAFWGFAVLLYAVVPPPTTPYILAEGRRLGGTDHVWVRLEDIAPVMARSVVAAEDANYCLHWGFDMAAIRSVVAAGGTRGASTLTQQTVKNAYLWQGRSWLRKAMEAVLTPMVELVWSKPRILEVYLNVAEFDEGVFGVDAAARRYFNTGPDQLSATQAARLAAVLPNPKERDAANPSDFVRRRSAQIADGAALIARDGRADCFDG